MLKYERLLDDNVRNFLKDLIEEEGLIKNGLEGIEHKIRSLPGNEHVLKFASYKMQYTDGLEAVYENKHAQDITDLMASHFTLLNRDSADDLIDTLEHDVADHYMDDFVDQLTAIAAEEYHDEMFEAGHRLVQDRENGEYNYV